MNCSRDRTYTMAVPFLVVSSVGGSAYAATGTIRPTVLYLNQA
jgi:hypothetical protein